MRCTSRRWVLQSLGFTFNVTGGSCPRTALPLAMSANGTSASSHTRIARRRRRAAICIDFVSNGECLGHPGAGVATAGARPAGLLRTGGGVATAARVLGSTADACGANADDNPHKQ